MVKWKRSPRKLN